MKISILVVLYQCDLNSSKTLSSLNSLKLFEDVNVDVVNNGPDFIEEQCDRLKYKFSLIQQVENRKLSVVYNEFINRNESDYYVILDYDTILGDDYVDLLNGLAANEVRKNDVIIPKVLCGERQFYPKNKREYRLFEKNTLISIGSGLILGRDVIQKIRIQFGSVFDERFHIYGVDSSIFRRLNRLYGGYTELVDGTIYHSLSSQEIETTSVKKFRGLERSSDLGLSLRYYPSLRLLCYLIYFVFTCYFKIGVYKDYSLSEVFKSLITGKHYKDR